MGAEWIQQQMSEEEQQQELLHWYETERQKEYIERAKSADRIVQNRELRKCVDPEERVVQSVLLKRGISDSEN